MHQIKLTFIAVLGMILSSPSHALRSDREKPIDIKADRVEVNEVTETSHYIGNVHLQQGSLNIHANVVVVYLKNGKLDKIVIDGSPATFEQQPEDRRDIVRSTARNMEYFAGKQLLVLKKDASVVQGANHFSGDFIEYDTLNSTVKANKDVDSDSRVHAIIQPESSDKQAAPEQQKSPLTPSSAGPAPEQPATKQDDQKATEP